VFTPPFFFCFCVQGYLARNPGSFHEGALNPNLGGPLSLHNNAVNVAQLVLLQQQARRVSPHCLIQRMCAHMPVNRHPQISSVSFVRICKSGKNLIRIYVTFTDSAEVVQQQQQQQQQQPGRSVGSQHAGIYIYRVAACRYIYIYIYTYIYMYIYTHQSQNLPLFLTLLLHFTTHTGVGSHHFAGAVEASSVSQSHALARARWGTCCLFLTLILTLLLSQCHGHVVLARARWGTDLRAIYTCRRTSARP
jgi:hypothetical protein